MTHYYDEFLRYYEMCDWQQKHCNLGVTPYENTPYDDDLMKNIHLFDVSERKYAGFTQLLLDMWYNADEHPYKDKLSDFRKKIIADFAVARKIWGKEEWLYAFFVHRLTGSGINYALKPSGYHNSVLLAFDKCRNVADMVEVIKDRKTPMFTSKGYQIAAFPKSPDPKIKPGVYFLTEYLPKLVEVFSESLNAKKDFREHFDVLKKYNEGIGSRVFNFQYAASLADVADFFPEYVNLESPFFYGTNAVECLSYLAEPVRGMNKIKFLDAIMERIYKDTGALPYNAEDVCCDFIRWVENYVDPRGDYSHVDRDAVWSSHGIKDHPFGRQKPMLELGIIKSFKELLSHPSDDKVLKMAGWSVDQYKAALI